MIIVKLKGGLGNQMFQYAIGRAVSIEKKTALLLDISSFERDDRRKYALHNFSLSPQFAEPEDIKKFQKFRRKDGAIWRVRNFLFSDWSKYAQEKQFHYDPDIFDVDVDSFIDGYWNTERYFKDIRETILSDFAFSDNPSLKNIETLELMERSESVSVHIRRGDYANNPHTNHIHGTLGKDYYKQALIIMREKILTPIFFVFSDDINWAKVNLNFPKGTTFVDWNGEEDASQDLRLMSNCKHHIIANSTFSWWGAWLSRNSNKTVIGPKKWFNAPKPNTDTKDVMPPEWIKI